MDQLKDLFISTKGYSVKLFTDYLFYIGGLLGTIFYYLTGFTTETLYSVLIIIFADIFTRCWAEYKNKRKILSRKMSFGFVGKVTTYMILFTFANHAFYLSDIFNYIVIGGFVLVEGWSIIENLKDAGQQKTVELIEQKFKGQIEKFKNDNSPPKQEDETLSQ